MIDLNLEQFLNERMNYYARLTWTVPLDSEIGYLYACFQKNYEILWREEANKNSKILSENKIIRFSKLKLTC